MLIKCLYFSHLPLMALLLNYLEEATSNKRSLVKSLVSEMDGRYENVKGFVFCVIKLPVSGVRDIRETPNTMVKLFMRV